MCSGAGAGIGDLRECRGVCAFTAACFAGAMYSTKTRWVGAQASKKKHIGWCVSSCVSVGGVFFTHERSLLSCEVGGEIFTRGEGHIESMVPLFRMALPSCFPDLLFCFVGL